MPRNWSFLSHHGLVLLAIARRPDLRLREIGGVVGISPRAAQSIVTELVASGFLLRSRVGRRNEYQVRRDRPLPDRAASNHDAGDLVGALMAGPRTRRKTGTRHAVVLGCSDYEFQEPLRDLMAAEQLLGRADVVLWPGGAGALTGAEANVLIEVMTGAATAERPQRVLLVAHEGCSAWTSAESERMDPFLNVRAIRRRRANSIAAVAAGLHVWPESWYLTSGGAFRVDPPNDVVTHDHPSVGLL